MNRIEDRFQGALIPAVPVPLRNGKELDQEATERLAAYIARADAAGVAVWAHTGRGLLLDEEMAVQTLGAWRTALPGRLIIAGAGCKGSSTIPAGPRGDATLAAGARRMASLAAENGADAVLAHPPSRFRDFDPGRRLDAIVEYHRQIVAEGLPTLAFYLFESAGGVRYTVEELREILGIPGVVGIKVATLDSVMTYQDIADFIARDHPAPGGPRVGAAGSQGTGRGSGSGRGSGQREARDAAQPSSSLTTSSTRSSSDRVSGGPQGSRADAAGMTPSVASAWSTLPMYPSMGSRKRHSARRSALAESATHLAALFSQPRRAP